MSDKKSAPRGAMVDVQCHCGTLFQARAADVARGWGKSCSKACSKLKPIQPIPPAPSRDEPWTMFTDQAGAFGQVVAISDPDLAILRLLHELSHAIKLTTGREAEITIWPKDIPFFALDHAIVGTYAGMRIIAPIQAFDRLGRRVG